MRKDLCSLVSGNIIHNTSLTPEGRTRWYNVNKIKDAMPEASAKPDSDEGRFTQPTNFIQGEGGELDTSDLDENDPNYALKIALVVGANVNF